MLGPFKLNLPFYVYGIIVFIGFLAGLWLLKANIKKYGADSLNLAALSLIISASALVGARIYYIALFSEYFNSISSCLAVYEGGLVFYGALIGVVLGLFAYCALKKISFAKTLDLLAPSFALAHAIGRFGCLFNGCCFGKPTSFLKVYRLKSDIEGVYRHPTQLYESFFMFFLAVFLCKTLKYTVKKGIHGLNGSLYLLSYAVFRFLIEFLRGDERGCIFGVVCLSPAQITSVIIALFSIFFLFYAIISANHSSEASHD